MPCGPHGVVQTSWNRIGTQPSGRAFSTIVWSASRVVASPVGSVVRMAKASTGGIVSEQLRAATHVAGESGRSCQPARALV